MDPYNSADARGVLPNAAQPLPAAVPASNPYAAPRAAVRDVDTPGEIVLASRLGRLGAVLIDSAIVAVPMIVAAIAVPGFAQFATDAQSGAAPSGGAFAAVLGVLGLGMIALAVYQLVLLYRSGQTVGKKIVGIRIVRPDGGRASFPRLLFLRYLVPGLIGAIPLVGFLFALVDALFIFAEDRRTLHDKIADTIVVNA
jgi:uncharacterized RDD family membrane protein YckC